MIRYGLVLLPLQCLSIFLKSNLFHPENLGPQLRCGVLHWIELLSLSVSSSSSHRDDRGGCNGSSLRLPEEHL